MNKQLQKSKIFSSDEVEELISLGDYVSALETLFEQQKKSWKDLASAYKALADVKTKTLRINNFRLKVLFNAGRIKSTTANTDDDSIKSRKCFLCIENLPKDQQGINYIDKFIMLCNPFPIFPEHFTIVSYQHQPQLIKNHFKIFLNLTKHLSDRYSVLYNGPKCGASAPDHLHFQAGNKNTIILNDDIVQLKNESGKILHENETIILSAIDDGLRKIILFESKDENVLQSSFYKFYDSYQSLCKVKDEPMMNLISNYDDEIGWIIIVFLRSKHRPESYFKEDDQRLIVSPAAADLGGLLITPREEDFKKMNEEVVNQIFREVSLDDGQFLNLVELIKKNFSSLIKN